MYFEYMFPSDVADHYSSKPIQKNSVYNNFRITYDFFFSYDEYYKVLQYLSDEGFVFEDNKRFESFTYDDISSKTEIYPKGTNVHVNLTFGTVSLFMNSMYADRHKRLYPKLQSVLANIGGVMKFILFIGNVLAKYITANMMIIDLSNIVIDHDYKGQKERTTRLGILGIDKELVHKDIGVIMERKVKIRKKQLSLLEAIMPKQCISKTSAKHNIDICRKVLKKKLSSDNLLVLIEQFNNFKNIVLNKEKQDLLENIRRFSIEECKNNQPKQVTIVEERVNTSRVGFKFRQSKRVVNDPIDIVNDSVKKEKFQLKHLNK
jgi:hypothetical protein